MRFTDQQAQEINKAAMPLMEWLNTNCHPHCKAIVDSERCEIVEGQALVMRRDNVIACPSTHS